MGCFFELRVFGDFPEDFDRDVGHASALFEGLRGEACPEDDAFVVGITRGDPQRKGIGGKADFFWGAGGFPEERDRGKGSGVGEDEPPGKVALVAEGFVKIVQHFPGVWAKMSVMSFMNSKSI